MESREESKTISDPPELSSGAANIPVVWKKDEFTLSRGVGGPEGRLLEISKTNIMYNLQLGDLKPLLETAIRNSDYSSFVYLMERGHFIFYRIMIYFGVKFQLTEGRAKILEYLLDSFLGIFPVSLFNVERNAVGEWLTLHEGLSLRDPEIRKLFFPLRDKILSHSTIQPRRIEPFHWLDDIYHRDDTRHPSFVELISNVIETPLNFWRHMEDEDPSLEHLMLEPLYNELEITPEFLDILLDYDNLHKVYKAKNFPLDPKSFLKVLTRAQVSSLFLTNMSRDIFRDDKISPEFRSTVEIKILGFNVNRKKLKKFYNLLVPFEPEKMIRLPDDGRYWILTGKERFIFETISSALDEIEYDLKNYPYGLSTYLMNRFGKYWDCLKRFVDFIPVADLIEELKIKHCKDYAKTIAKLIETNPDFTEKLKEALPEIFVGKPYYKDFYFEILTSGYVPSKIILSILENTGATAEIITPIVRDMSENYRVGGLFDLLYEKGFIKPFDPKNLEECSWMITDDILYVLITKYLDFSEISPEIFTIMKEKFIISGFSLMVDSYIRVLDISEGKRPVSSSRDIKISKISPEKIEDVKNGFNLLVDVTESLGMNIDPLVERARKNYPLLSGYWKTEELRLNPRPNLKD